VPVVKNSPVFALGRDDEALLDNNLRLIRTNLEILDSCLTTYGTSLVTKSNKFNKLYETPSVKYVIQQLENHDFKNFKILEDNNSHLNFPRTIILGEK